MASEENILQESGDVPFIPESISSHDLAISNFSQVLVLFDYQFLFGTLLLIKENGYQ